MACGTGKTLVSLWLHEKLNAKRTLILVACQRLRAVRISTGLLRQKCSG